MPTAVRLLMTELFSVELEANKPEIVDVAIVEVATVDEVMVFIPAKMVLPPWMERVLEAVPPES